MPERRTLDVARYVESMRTRPCFICGLVSGDPAFAHHVVFEDEFAIAFLNKFPPLLGYVLVCPKAHLEQVTGDFSQQGNRHVHWHVAPLPPGVAPEQQQFAALDVERAGYLAMDEAEMTQLAARIAAAIRDAGA